MRFNKIYGCCLSIIYVVIVEILFAKLFGGSFLWPALTGNFEGVGPAWCVWAVVILCELGPALVILFGTFAHEGDSLAAQIFFPLLYILIALIAAAGIFIIILLIYDLINNFNFGHLMIVVLLIGLIGAPTYYVIEVFFD